MTKGKATLELLRAASNATVRAGETIQVLEVYVSGDRGGQAGGVKLFRCDRGWAASHDNLQQRLLAPVSSSVKQKRVDVRDLPFTYMYFYGLFAHKLAHFFDVVHGALLCWSPACACLLPAPVPSPVKPQPVDV